MKDLAQAILLLGCAGNFVSSMVNHFQGDVDHATYRAVMAIFLAIFFLLLARSGPSEDE